MNVVTSKKDYIWSYFAYIMKFGVNIFIFPLVLRILPTEEYGIWVTFSSIGTIINLFDFGFSSTILRNMTYVWSGAQTLELEGYIVQKKDAETNDRLYALTFMTCRRIYLVIAAVATITSVTIGTVYIIYITREMFDFRYILAWLVYALSIGMNLFFSYWTVSLKSIGAIKQSQKAVVISIAVQLVVSYAGLLCGFGVLALALAACICGVVVRMISRMYFIRMSDMNTILKEFKNDIKTKEISYAFKIIWFNAKKAGISSVAVVFLTQSTTLICSARYGLEVVGAYGLCLQLLNMLSGVSQVYYQTTIPLLTQARQQRNMPKCRKLFSASVTISYIVFIGGVAFAALCGPWLLHLIGSQTHLDITMFVIMAVYIFGEMSYSMHASFISLENRLPFVPSVVVTVVVSVLLSLSAAYLNLNIWYMLAIRIFVESAYIFWKWPLEAHRQIDCGMWKLLGIGITEIKNTLLNKS